MAIELLSLLSAASVLVVGVILIGLWSISCVFSTRWRKICFGICSGLLALNACFGFAAWIVMIVERRTLHDPLDSRTAIFGRERIIAAGFASWGLVLLAQVLFLSDETDRRLHSSLFLHYILVAQISIHQHRSVPQRYHPP